MKKMAAIATVVCVLVPTMQVWAQEAGGDAAGVYLAEVIGRDIHVRSGPSATAYHCVQLSTPAKVTVVGKSGAWLKIIPPQGCYSVVSKKSVALDAGAKTGKVIGENVWARAGGFPEDPGEYSMLQKALKADEPVKILGQVETYYKVVPPSGAYFWIAAKDVKRIAGAVKPPDPTTTKPATTKDPTTKPVVPRAVYKPHPDVVALGKLDKELQAEYKKPAKDRDFSALLAKYQAFEPTKDSGVRPHVAKRVEHLELEIQRQKDAAEVAGVVDDARKDYEDFQIAWTKLATGPVPPPAPTGTGIIVPSHIYSTDSTIGKRHVLRDTKIMRINAYLINTDGKIDLGDYADKTVEVYGRSGYDRFLGMDVIDVQKVVILSDSGALPKPPSPTIRLPVKPVKKDEKEKKPK